MARSLYQPKLTEHEAKSDFAQAHADFKVLAFITFVVSVIVAVYSILLMFSVLSNDGDFWRNNMAAFIVYGLMWVLLISLLGLTTKVYSQYKNLKQIVATKNYTRYAGPFLGGI